MPPNRNFLQKVTKSDSKREPTWDQKSPKWRLFDLSKHMVFTARITHWAVLGHLREHFFSAPLSGHCFFVFFVTFWDLGCQKGTQRGAFFPRRMAKNRFRRQIAPRRSRSPKRVPRSRQMSPKATQDLWFWCPKVTEMGRELCCFRRLTNNATTGQKQNLERSALYFDCFLRRFWRQSTAKHASQK